MKAVEHKPAHGGFPQRPMDRRMGYDVAAALVVAGCYPVPVEHRTRVVTQPGPGTSSASWAACSCGWESPTRSRREEAESDAVGHLLALEDPPPLAA